MKVEVVGVRCEVASAHTSQLRGHTSIKERPPRPNNQQLRTTYIFFATFAVLNRAFLRAPVPPWSFPRLPSMKKDIALPKLDGVAMAIVQEADPDGEQAWYVYVVNDTDKELSNVLVSSRGYGTIQGEARSTSTMRHHLPVLQARNWARIERIVEEVFPLNNQYWLSFYADGSIHDRKFIFVPDSIQAENFTSIPLMDARGVLIA